MRVHLPNVFIFMRGLQIVLTCLLFEVANGGFGIGGVPTLLFVTRKDIRVINSNINRSNAKIKAQILVRNITDGAALDINFAAKKVCWSDHGLEMIQCATYNGGEIEDKTEVITTGMESPEGIACDWFTNKIYWTDGGTNSIEVATMTGGYRKVLFWSDIDQPRAIVLVPMKGIMFWTDWGEAPKIERAGMNGDSATRKVIVNNNIFWPNGLTVDFENELIYWIDGKLHFIDVMDYEGKNRRTLVNNLNYPFSLTQFQNKLFWTDWNTWCVHMCDKSTPLAQKSIIHSDFVPMYIKTWNESRQPAGPNPCEPNNGGCSHLCLLAPYEPGYTCACPIGIKLVDNFTCAVRPHEILLLAIRTDICVVYLDSLDYTHNIIPLTGIKYSIAVDYDPVNDFLYWTDDIVKAIRRAKLDGSQQEDVVVDDVHHPDGLAVDWVAQNLYWTDTGSDRIEVSRLNGSYRKVLLFKGLVEPRAIAVAPEHGWMFWSDWNEKQPKIERAVLDGSERVLIVNSSLGWPNGITLDLENDKIYWCDAKIDKIEMASFDGSNRIELTSDNLPHTFGLSLMGDYIYWTDWQRRAIDRVHKTTGTNRETITDQIANVMGLKAVRLGDVRGTNPCKIDNGGCEHLCLNRPGNKYICACQDTYELYQDNRTCVMPDSFILVSKHESIGRISIENENDNRNDITIAIANIKLVSSLDFDVANMRMYWSDVKVRAIFRAFLNGSDTQRVIDLGIQAPEGMAVDWMAHNIYWTDTVAHKIEVARLDGSSRRALLWKGLDEPRDIALDPAKGYMYWAEWGSAHCIKRASLNGSQPIVLISHTGNAKGLTIDYDDQRLYWTDILNPAVRYFSLNGKFTKTISSSDITKPMDLTLFKDKIYWIDTDKLYAANKTTGDNREIIISNLNGVTDLLVVHSSKQHKLNQCSVSNGGCSNLCLALPSSNYLNYSTSHTCACPTHYVLQNNTCKAPSSFIIYSLRNSVIRLLPDTADYPEAVLPIQGLNRIKAIDFDPVSRFLYWIEGKTHSIKRALDNGSSVSVVVLGNSDQRGGPYDLAVDSIGRLLFWSCSIQDVINVTRLDNASTIGTIMKEKGGKPRLIAIHPIKRLLFWTDNGNEPQLMRARLDGSHRIRMIKPRQNITAIALDLDTDMIVWAESHKLYMCNIDGENKHSFLSETKMVITHMAIHFGFMYWLERNQNQLRKFNLRNAKQETLRLPYNMTLTDLVSVREFPKNHSCFLYNKCSDICIGNETNVVCACPHGLALKDDQRTCVAIPECEIDYFTCGRNRYTPTTLKKDCIPGAWRCDGQNDCADGSDEVDCPACQADQFRCTNGDCISKAAVCDGHRNCTDGFDEARCCEADQFKCLDTGVCIPNMQLCDGMDNCADSSDESESACKIKNTANFSTSAASTYVIVILACMLLAGLIVMLWYYCRTRHCPDTHDTPLNDQATDPLSPKLNNIQMKSASGKLRNKAVPDLVHMSMLTGSQTLSYDRCHITGASSSTNGSSLTCYPRETLNPPPSPATTAASTRGSSPGRYRPYKHYRSINQPPPPTPCSTDVCDESDCNYPTKTRYDGGPVPPPPTPRSNCHTESCPPSPSSRSSTYFSPLPPPPSPVPSSPYREYDS